MPGSFSPPSKSEPTVRNKTCRYRRVIGPGVVETLNHLCSNATAPPPKTLHMQSALNADKRIMSFVLEALEPAGTEIVRCRFAWRRMLPPTTSPMSDITSPGGWAALTGQQLWLVSSIFPFVLSPVFSSPDSLVSAGLHVGSCLV